jgi:hypothetical protein
MPAAWASVWRAACADLAAGLAGLAGGTAPGGTAPGGTAPGETAPGGTAPGGTAPGGTAPSVLAYLYSRVGFECGRFLRALHDERCSWGTYQDAACRADLGEWHCNAHANNMALLEEEEGVRRRSFLCYLDLDMAFHQADFVDVLARTPTCSDSGPGTEAFDALLLRERVCFLESLAGADSSGGVPDVAGAELRARSPALRAVRTALRDTLVVGFQSGYDGGGGRGELRVPLAPAHAGGLPSPDDVAAFDPRLHRAAYAVLRLAVCVTGDYVA